MDVNEFQCVGDFIKSLVPSDLQQPTEPVTRLRNTAEIAQRYHLYVDRPAIARQFAPRR
jgi:hypothetical protein